MSRNVHVEPSPGGWSVKEGTRRGKTFRTKAEALAAGSRLARQNRSEQIVHSRSGRIEERNSYRQDPFPPRREP